MKVYVTKYALTQGIYPTDIEDCGHGMVKESKAYGQYLHEPDWHRSLESAKQRAKDMQAAKIRSLEKQLARVKALEF